MTELLQGYMHLPLLARVIHVASVLGVSALTAWPSVERRTRVAVASIAVVVLASGLPSCLSGEWSGWHLLVEAILFALPACGTSAVLALVRRWHWGWRFGLGVVTGSALALLAPGLGLLVACSVSDCL